MVSFALGSVVWGEVLLFFLSFSVQRPLGPVSAWVVAS